MKYVGSFLFALLLFVTTAAHAQSIYTIPNYTVELGTGNPEILREKALLQGGKEAFIKLLQKLTPQEVWYKHPQIMQSVDVDTMVAHINVEKETLSPHYKLEMSVTFNEQNVRDLLEDLNISYSEAGGGKVILVPLLDLPDRTVLWEDNNPWRKALESYSSENHFFEIVVPASNDGDTRRVTPEMASFGAGDVLLDLAKKYDASAALVAKARVVPRTGGQRLEVELSWFGENSVVPVAVNIPVHPDEGIDQILSFAAIRAMGAFVQNWQESQLVQVDRKERVFLRFAPKDVDDLEKMKNTVAQIKTVKDISLRVLNRRDSIFQLDFFGNPENLQQQLVDAGLNVSSTRLAMVWAVSFKENGYGF